MERRGFVIGDYDTAADKWTLTGWKLSAPKMLTDFVTVPGRRKGPLDLSAALTDGDPVYSSRTLTATFECSEGNRLERESRIDAMVNSLDGRRLNIYLPDDQQKYIVGRVGVERLYNDMAFKGHFPGNPIMPGVLIVESLAQTGAVAILSMKENKGKNALFGGIEKMKFKKQVVPGDRLKLEVKIIKKKGPIGVGEAIATCENQIVAKGELMFALV